MAPLYTPRPVSSKAAMCRMALSLGAPVIDPMGKVARMMSSGVTPSAKVHETELIIWCTVEKV